MTIYQDPELFAFLIHDKSDRQVLNYTIYIDECVDVTSIQSSDRLVYHKE